MGMLASTVEHHELRACQSSLMEIDEQEALSLLFDMRENAIKVLAQQGYEEPDIIFSQEIDLRLQGQDSALSMRL